MVAAIRGMLQTNSTATELLRVRIVRGEKLGKRDLFGACDPYIVVKLEGQDGEVIDEITLEKKRKCRNPTWNSYLMLRVTRQCVLKLLVYDANTIRKDQLLGYVEFNLSDESLSNSSGQPKCYILRGGKSKDASFLYLGLRLMPNENGSSGRVSPVESATNLASSADSSTVVEGNTTLPEGWEEREDANGRTYYVNHHIHVIQFERPTSADNDNRVLNQSEMETRRRRDDYEMRSQMTESSPTAVARHLDAIDAGMRSNFEGGHRSTDPDDEDPLPDGWDMQIAPNGRTFFIDHSTKTTTWTDPRTGRSSAANERQPARHRSVGTTDDEIGSLPPGWEQRIHTDGRVFFIDHNKKRTQWEDPRFENESIAGPDIPYSRDYKRKVEYLRTKLPRATHSGKCDIVVRRESLFEDSFRQIMEKDPVELRYKLWIEFVGETGLDYGGVTREWFFLLSHQMFNPYYGLFEYSATDNYTLQINPHSEYCNPEHLNYFYFIGKIIGMAIYHGKLLDAFFIRPFYKMMLDKKITLMDMESVDNEYYNSLIFVKDNDPESLELTFSVDESIFGETVTVDLIPTGSKVRVTEENKESYIESVIQWRFVKRVEPQMRQILKGLHEVVPNILLGIFDANELELLMCGLQKIDVKDWKANTIYKGGYGPSSQVVHNFWKCILSFDNEMRARVLQFVSGTSRVPMNGFRELYGSNGPQKFTIEKWGNPDMLPRAHTCFNRLDLPPYLTFHELRQKLITAIENSEIFSGVD
ncbi:hypothetical protein WR25_21113 [Diploscapter pachys]|uniref:E3 ubiquitin-protein ligase n=1 Tax=Diploscapter pachys TaxID=2018661 RepID=A0A2A2KTN3_9BILA|nr:hypothetical protein WR25_21113 [Diploscapter pachys]